jgi:hypothetical protein
MLLEGDPAESGGRLDLSTGDCRPTFTEGLDDAGSEVEEVDDPERWLHVPASGSRAGYRDMEPLIEGLDDAALADRLRIAVGGREPSGASRASSPVTSVPGAGITGSAMSGSVAGPGPGWPRRATSRSLPYHGGPDDRRTPSPHSTRPRMGARLHLREGVGQRRKPRSGSRAGGCPNGPDHSAARRSPMPRRWFTAPSGSSMPSRRASKSMRTSWSGKRGLVDGPCLVSASSMSSEARASPTNCTTSPRTTPPFS